MQIRAWKLLVQGRVQGVGFRYFTERAARQLGIKGYVRNTFDGSVEVVAITGEEIFPVFLQKIKEGPAMARVDKVDVESLETVPQEYNSFRVAF